MKRFLTALTLLLSLGAGPIVAQTTQWQFVKVFPDTTFISPYGVHGLAVAPDGNVWIAPSWATDSVKDADNVWWPVVQIFVFRPDGTPTAFSGFKILSASGIHDTLWNGTQGMRTDAHGNVIYATYDSYWRIDYKTGNGIARVIPIKDEYVVAPAFTSANEMFEAYILPGKPMKIYDNNFTYLGTALDSCSGFSRAFEVSKDGNNIYWAGYTLNMIQVYHSNNGTLGPYLLKDSMAFGFQVESFAWNKKSGLLYVSGGNIDTADYGPFLPGHDPMKWLGIDPATKTVKDSIAWNWNAYPYAKDGANAPRPRVIDFSVSGDTAYVGCFWQEKAAVQMFKRVLTGVSQIDPRVPDAYALQQNFPNPFNPATTIQFAIARAGWTVLKVYDLLGKEIATLVNEQKDPGTYSVVLDGSHLSSGMYVCSLTNRGVRLNRKMLLAK